MKNEITLDGKTVSTLLVLSIAYLQEVDKLDEEQYQDFCVILDDLQEYIGVHGDFTLSEGTQMLKGISKKLLEKV